MSDARLSSPSSLSLQKLLRICFVALGAGLLLSIIGPFGTYENMVGPTRFGFWIGAVLLGTFIHVPLLFGASLLGRQHNVPSWIWVTGSAILAALPMTFVVNGIAATLFPGGSFDGLFELYPLVLAISLPMQWMTHLTSDFILPVPFLREADPNVAAISNVTSPEQDLTPSPIGSPNAPALLLRIPARLGKTILCLEMEDHYLRIHTTLGDTMIHLRMADAITELDGIEGMLVHRSWWVAREAITGWNRDGKTLLLQLSNGKSVPVARDRQPLVKAAGWLE
jgi:LytTr DNA-binding domain